MSLPMVCVVFSRDRAMQLDAALRSFYLHAAGADGFPLAVLYRATDARHARQYQELSEDWRSRSNVHFLPQTHFWRDLLGWVGRDADPDFVGRENIPTYRRLLRLGHRFSFLRRPALQRLLSTAAPAVLFLVDDTLFVRDFRLADVLTALNANPQALGFSLRLGANITHCYVLDRPQPQPAFTPAGPPAKTTPAILTYDWTRAELDFAYPLEVSSSVYRLADLLPSLDGRPFANPNDLEVRLAEGVHRFRSRPQLLCYVHSVAFSNPVNKVNPDYQNRAGVQIAYSAADLAEKFDQGYRVAVAAYRDFVPHACHQEVELAWLPPGAPAPAGQSPATPAQRKRSSKR